MVSGEKPNISRRACGGFVALRSGVRGGNGTSQPNLIMPEKNPAMIPTSTAILRRRREGSVMVVKVTLTFSAALVVMGAFIVCLLGFVPRFGGVGYNPV